MNCRNTGADCNVIKGIRFSTNNRRKERKWERAFPKTNFFLHFQFIPYCYKATTHIGYVEAVEAHHWTEKIPSKFCFFPLCRSTCAPCSSFQWTQSPTAMWIICCNPTAVGSASLRSRSHQLVVGLAAKRGSHFDQRLRVVDGPRAVLRR